MIVRGTWEVAIIAEVYRRCHDSVADLVGLQNSWSCEIILVRQDLQISLELLIY